MVLFSIIIPCYNQAHFLPDCLDSLLEQNYQQWEAFVVNDGSTDDTSEVVKRYALKDRRIRLIEKNNGGLSSARNYGLQFAIGERIIFLDSDDFLYQECLEKVAFVEKESNHRDLIQYGYSYITENKERILVHIDAVNNEQMSTDILTRNLGPCHSICISKSLSNVIGLFDESLNSIEDWDYWMRAIKAGGKPKIIKQPLAYYRYSKNSMSRNPFVMYDALKVVIGRGPQKDSRITIESSLNINRDFNIQPILKDFLLQTIGVGIMQNKINETLDFFNRETLKPINEYKPKEFEIMCSYLSFRYWYSPEDIKEVFTSIYPNFICFFNKASYNKKLTKKALYHIFRRHINHKNINLYGKIIGSILNFIMRNYHDRNLFRLKYA